MYAIVHGVPEQLASWLTGMTLAVVTTSVVVHGISVTPSCGTTAAPVNESRPRLSAAIIGSFSDPAC